MISVIIPHRNQPALLDSCLTSLDAQSLDRSRFEVIVVDNGSNLLPEAVVARHAGVRLIGEPKPGPGMARNTGVNGSSGEILAFIDADCRAHPDWLRTALAALADKPPRSILGGDVQIWREADSKLTALEAYETLFAYRFQLYIERHGYSGTGNLVVRRSDFEDIGGFHDIKVAEDMEWGSRACAAGYRFRYIPEMIVYHPARTSLGDLFVKWDRHTQHYLNMARGQPAWRIRWFARTLAILASPFIDLPTVIASPKITGIPARIKAASVLFTVRFYRAWTMMILAIRDRKIAWNSERGFAPDS